jgi:hypothetical protein
MSRVRRGLRTPGSPSAPGLPGAPSAPFLPLSPFAPVMPGVPGRPGVPSLPSTPGLPEEHPLTVPASPASGQREPARVARRCSGRQPCLLQRTTVPASRALHAPSRGAVGRSAQEGAGRRWAVNRTTSAWNTTLQQGNMRYHVAACRTALQMQHHVAPRCNMWCTMMQQLVLAAWSRSTKLWHSAVLTPGSGRPALGLQLVDLCGEPCTRGCCGFLGGHCERREATVGTRYCMSSMRTTVRPGHIGE